MESIPKLLAWSEFFSALGKRRWTGKSKAAMHAHMKMMSDRAAQARARKRTRRKPTPKM